MKYKGWDYTELFPVLGIPESAADSDFAELWFRVALSEIRSAMLHEDGSPDEHEHKMAEIRKFLQAMIDGEYDYWGPIWNGMLDCEDDETFLQACIALAGHMWT